MADWIGEIPAFGVDPEMAWGIGKYALQLQEKERKEAEKKEKRTTDRPIG